MNKKERWIIYPFLIILIIVAFTALCQEHPRIGGFDYLGFIMGILSFLLAILGGGLLCSDIIFLILKDA